MDTREVERPASAICERCLATVHMTEVERRERVAPNGAFLCDACKAARSRRAPDYPPERWNGKP